MNRFGHDKVFINCRCLDHYKGHHNGHGLTHNMIDVRAYIPDRNLFLEEHFFYRYLCRSRGSPESLLCNLLKEGLSRLYERYYVENDY